MQAPTLMKILSRLLSLLLFTAPASFAQEIPGQYIVVFRNGVNSSNAASVIARQNNVGLGHVYANALSGFSFSGSAVAAQAIGRNPNVAYVEADLQAYSVSQELVTGVDRIDADLNVIAKIDGIDDRVDVDVAIIDTGIDVNHPDLNVVGGKHFYTITSGKRRGSSSSDNNYDDDAGHGTHVAGTVAALDNGIGVVGIAPGARLWAVKVLDSNGSGSFSDIIAGIDYVTANSNVIEVVNMSLGGQGSLNSLRTAIQNSVAAGVVYIVAAGNSGMDVYGNDGVFGNTDDFIPAAYPEVAAVSAMGDTDGQSGSFGANTSRSTADDTFADFTNYSRSVVSNNPVFSAGAAIDLAAPGVDITSTYMGGVYATMSGTSMASPHVAGLAALEIAANGRALNAADVASIRQVLIAASDQQANWGPGNTFDPDSNHEGLANAASGPVDYAPQVSIVSPTNNEVFASGTVVVFSGTAVDYEDGVLTSQIDWTLDIDSTLGTGDGGVIYLSNGAHSITASVTDSTGKTSSATVDITVGEQTVANAVSVVDVAYSLSGGKSRDKDLQITLSLQNNLGTPVSNASVSITLYRDGVASGSATTSTLVDGTASLVVRNLQSGCYTTEVTNIQADGLIWNGTWTDPGICK
jgi:subtilisin